MSFRRVFCIGETVLDVIIDGERAVVRPGGSTLNSAVSLGRAGRKVSFISDVALDDAGNLIAGFLANNGVDTAYLHRYNHGKTTVALAFLDEHRDARYSFYKDYHGKRLPVTLPEPGPDDIVLFGSYYAIADDTFDTVNHFIVNALKNGALTMYDPNFRESHLGELERMKPRIGANIAAATLVRGSDADFRIIFGVETGTDAYVALRKHGCSHLVYTRNAAGVEYHSPEGQVNYPVPVIDPVSTVGAGDAFNAGIIHAMLDDTGAGTIDAGRLIPTGIRFSTAVCMSSENYIPRRPDDNTEITTPFSTL